MGADYKRSCFLFKLLSSPPAQVLTALRAQNLSRGDLGGHRRSLAHSGLALLVDSLVLPVPISMLKNPLLALDWPQALPCLGFTSNPTCLGVGMTGSSWIFFFFSLVMLSSRLEAAGNSLSWVQDEAEERPPGSALGTALCHGGTFFLKGGRRGDNARSPWQQQRRDAGETAVSWQRCWAGLTSSSRAEFQHFGLPGRGSAQPGWPRAGFENRNIPEIQELFKFLNPRKRIRSSGAEASIITCHSRFASPWN